MGTNYLLADILADDVETVTIPFGEWLPDLPKMNNPGAIEALNVIPSEGCYVPFPAHQPMLAALLPDIVRGATAFFLTNDLVYVYAGTVNGIYTGHPNGIDTGVSSFAQVYLSPPLYAENMWQFLRVNDQVVAIHPQVVVGSANVGGLTTFTPLGGSPPTAGCGAYINNFLVLGNLYVDPDAGGGAFPSRIRWSGFNNIDAPWISDPATQADFQDLPAAGDEVVGIVGRETGTIFQKHSISRMQYVGLPTVFAIETAENKRGALNRDCIVDIGAATFFIAEDGFFVWNGTNSTPIGDNVNRYFFGRLQYNYRHRIVGALDYVNGCVVWAFPTDSSGNLNELIIYSYRENRWSHAYVSIEAIFNTGASSISIDDLGGSLEDYTSSFDSAFYQTGGRPQLGAFNMDHHYGLFSGAPMAATLDTGEFTGSEGRRVYVNGARPNVDLAFPLASMQVAQRDQMYGGPLAFSAAATQEVTGDCSVLADARLVRFRTNLPAGAVWRHAVGVDISRKASGLV